MNDSSSRRATRIPMPIAASPAMIVVAVTMPLTRWIAPARNPSVSAASVYARANAADLSRSARAAPAARRIELTAPAAA